MNTTKPESTRSTHTREGILLLIATLTAIGAFANSQESWWYRGVTGFFLFVGIVVLVQNFIWPWSARVVRLQRGRSRQRQAAQALFREFQELVQAFARFVEPNQEGHLAGYLAHVYATEPKWKDKLPRVPHVSYAREFFSVCQRRLDRWDGSYPELTALARDFSAVLSQHHQLFVLEPLDALGRFAPSEVPDQMRRKVNLLREQYVAFVNRYVIFAQAANARCGERVFDEYFRLPEAI